MSELIDVQDYAPDGMALEPSSGAALAAAVIQRQATGAIALDFKGVRVVASSFANAFFLGLAQAASLATWDRILSVRNLSVSMSQRWQQSRSAAEAATSQAAASP